MKMSTFLTEQRPRVKSKSRKRRERSAPSDVESIQTEDFENHFQNLMVKQVAQVPITSFDQLMVDSDLETVKSLLVQQKFYDALGRCGEEYHQVSNIRRTLVVN